MEYKRLHGNTNVPQSTLTTLVKLKQQPGWSKELARWVDQQRKMYKKSKLSEERIAELVKIDFEWKPKWGGARRKNKTKKVSSKKTSRR